MSYELVDLEMLPLYRVESIFIYLRCTVFWEKLEKILNFNNKNAYTDSFRLPPIKVICAVKRYNTCASNFVN